MDKNPVDTTDSAESAFVVSSAVTGAHLDRALAKLEALTEQIRDVVADLQTRPTGMPDDPPAEHGAGQ